MERISQLGTELAMLLRREHEHLSEAQRLGARIEALTKQIQQDDSGTLYHTGSFPQVPASVELRRTEEHVPPPDTHTGHLDGHTYRLTPIADTIVSGAAAIVSCPEGCEEPVPHIHTADGEVHPTRLVET